MSKPNILLLVCFLLPVTAALAQHDSTLLLHINKLIGDGQTARFRADRITKTDGLLQVYFNTDKGFNKGDVGEMESETLTELLAHLTTETATRNVVLLVREQASQSWKTLDYFVNELPLVKYRAVKNDDPFPDIAGKAGPTQARIFPGGGKPGVTGALTGKTVWLSPGHGWHNTGTGFITQRGTTNQLVEDFITAETVDYYLLHYLMNAGANVWSVRERDINTSEIIVNNDQGAPAYTETGSWSTGSIAGYGGTYRFSTAAATATATATFKPTVATSGLYWVSVRFISGANRTTDTKYTITHAGGTATYTVNQEVHGDTWIYLGQFYFFAGGNYSVAISNQSAEAGQAIIADAVRLGGGIGGDPDCVNGGSASSRPRFEESARQYARYQGNPVCREDVTVRPTYAEWELGKGVSAEIDNAVYVALHTNAGGGTGTETYRYNGLGSNPSITSGSTQLRDSIHKQVIADLRAGWRNTWTDRGVKEANFGELRELYSIPGTLVELAFHDLAADATDLKAPEFRRIAARAIYKGILKFFRYRDGVPLVFLPEEPTRLAAKNTGSSQIQVSWIAPVAGGIYGHAATGYRVYISENGRGYGNPVEVATTSYTFSGVPGTTYFFKVTAYNAGGESFASSVVAARTPATGITDKYLLVDGFDRLDASALLLKNESAALGNVRRMVLDKMNNYAYMVEHGNGFSSCNIAFDGVQNEAVGAGVVSLGSYVGVDWFVGEESTTERTLDATEKLLIKNYLDGGGRLMISGAEIGWDLGRAASPNADLSFFNNYLKATYVGDDAGTYNFTGTPALLNGTTGTFGNGFNGYYDVDFPDVVSVSGGSQLVLNYSGGSGGGAGVGYQGSFNVLYFGFPIEAITSDNVRNNLICQSATYLQGSTARIAQKPAEIPGKALFYILENPVTSTIRLRVSNVGAFRLQLANGQGQTVFQDSYKAISSGDVLVPAANLAKGMYWLTVQDADGRRQTFKILVQ
ncbi:golvesin C-terminal-like domain-containing protein [Paraflavitalea soli]|nr:N-acetylmuramoyl-L-alanine amidase [Paraflavitalea soli]